MKKSQISNVKCQILTLIFLLITLYSLLITPFALAQDTIESQEASGAAILGDQTLIEKINALKQEIASKASQLKLQVEEKIQNKAIPGEVSDLDDEVILLITKNGEKKIIVNEYTIFETDSDDPSFEDIRQQDYIVALGDLDDKGNLVAKKVIKLEKPKPSNKRFYSGEILDIASSTITVRTKTGEKNIIVSSLTSYGAGSDEASFQDLNIGKKIVAVGVPNKEEIIRADYIYLMPQGNPVPLPSKDSSPSASPN